MAIIRVDHTFLHNVVYGSDFRWRGRRVLTPVRLEGKCRFCGERAGRFLYPGICLNCVDRSTCVVLDTPGHEDCGWCEEHGQPYWTCVILHR